MLIVPSAADGSSVAALVSLSTTNGSSNAAPVSLGTADSSSVTALGDFGRDYPCFLCIVKVCFNPNAPWCSLHLIWPASSPKSGISTKTS